VFLLVVGAGYLIQTDMKSAAEIIVLARGEGTRDIEHPLGAVCANERGYRLVQAKAKDAAYLVKLKGTGTANDIDRPLGRSQLVAFSTLSSKLGCGIVISSFVIKVSLLQRARPTAVDGRGRWNQTLSCNA
jgi:hypothetical protein